MTSPRSTYGGGYYSAPSFQDTPIYDSLVAERGTPQIAPIRVPAAYDTGSHLPALPSALPALPSGPSGPPAPSMTSVAPMGQMGQMAPMQAAPTMAAQPNPAYGYAPGAPGPAPLQQAPAPHIPQQTGGPRGYPGAQPQRPGAPGPGGYEAMRPAAPRPAPAPHPEDPYNRQYRGY
ncbi:DUF6643 family protein [Streptomyces sp. G45]|uniref:DUF6643 family protein n=1 Tax=Streptomyces sp. G45 TaxID=3406627 RepID=UPI003C24662C